MPRRAFTVEKSSLVKALLYGHLANIGAGFLTFALTHWVLQWSTNAAVATTLLTTIALSVIVSLVGTRRLHEPLSALGDELNQLHEKVTQSTNALAQADQHNLTALDNLPLGILVFDEKFNLKRSNQLARQFFGFTPDEDQPQINSSALLECLKALQVGNSPINLADWLHQVKASEVSATQQWQLATLKHDGESRACDLIARFVRQTATTAELTLAIVDRSETYERQEKQMEFIAIAAHELRGPITVVRGLIDVFQHEVSPNLNPEQVKLLSRMAVSSRQLAGYVNNILNVSRVEQEGFAIKPESTNWLELLTASSEDLNARATAHQRELRLELPKTMPPLAVDPIAIQHVLTNLVDNAIKYSKSGGEIIISAKLKGEVVETTVQDFGVGIPASIVDNLFTKFYRSHRSKHMVSGTGLGLYLCKAILEAHGGNIWVRSTEGVGTTFGFTLPTFESVAEAIKKGDTTTSGIIRTSHGWIKNHALYRR